MEQYCLETLENKQFVAMSNGVLHQHIDMLKLELFWPFHARSLSFGPDFLSLV